MIQIGNQIISLDIFEKHFVCDLNACKGACCVEGDAGAPITLLEEEKIKNDLNRIKPYMRKKSVANLEKNGISIYDEEGDLTTSLINNKECVFVVYDKGVAKCSIEKAYLDGQTEFKKPISCHLFPVRIKEYEDFQALNYEKIKICKPACECGSKLKIPLYSFLKEPLIRKYGEEWYNQLLEAARLLD